MINHSRFKQRVLFVDHSSFVGGAELSLMSIVNCIGSNNCVITFAKGEFSRLLERSDVNYKILPNGEKLASITRNRSVWSLLASFNLVIKSVFWMYNQAKEYDLIYINTFKSIFLAIPVALISNKKIVIHFRDILSTSTHSRSVLFILKIMIKLSQPKIIANSIATQLALEQLGIKKSRITVIYNGFSFFAKPVIQEKIEPNAVIKVGVFSRIAYWKGQHIAIEALSSLDKNRFEMHFFGGCEDKEYLDSLLKFKDVNDLHNAKFFGHINDPLIAMKAMDIVVLPSVEPEPFGRVIVEAIMLGKVVIATNMGGVKEIITHRKTGLLIEPDPSVLREAILELSNDNQLRSSIVNCAFEFAKSRFSLEIMSKRLNVFLKMS